MPKTSKKLLILGLILTPIFVIAADAKISALTSYTTLLNADLFPVVDTANTATKQISWSNFKTSIKTYTDTLYSAFGYPFTTQNSWVATSTLINFTGGVMSTASSTFQNLGSIALPSLTLGGLGVNSSGVVYKYATTTFSYPLTYASGGVTFPATSTLYGSGTAGQVLMWNTNGNPTWTSTSTNVGNAVIGTLGVANGGTGATTWTVSQIPYGNGTGAISFVATSSETCTYPLACTAHNVLTGGGAITTAATSTLYANLVSGTLGQSNTGSTYLAATSSDISFALATTSLNVNSTTTIRFSGLYRSPVINQFGCTSNGGTFTSAIGDGSATSTYVVSSNSLTTTFTAQTNRIASGATILWAIGPASAANVSNPTCSINRN